LRYKGRNDSVFYGWIFEHTPMLNTNDADEVAGGEGVGDGILERLKWEGRARMSMRID
jgi:hypothetical protein